MKTAHVALSKSGVRPEKKWRRGGLTCLLAAWIITTTLVVAWNFCRGSPSPHPIALAITDTDPCTFEYAGPLRPDSLNCFLEYFPNAAPLDFPGAAAPGWRTLPAGHRRFHTWSGFRQDDGPPPVPIFILFKDRVSILLEMLRSIYRYLQTPFEIVIIHDNSTYPGASHFISRLKDSGVYVHENVHPWQDFDQFYSIVADFIKHYMQHAQSDVYVLSDPDCALDSAPWNLLSVYKSVLDEVEEVDVVGAALRWDDFPEELQGSKYEDRIAQLPAKAFAYLGRNYYFIEAQVDTTFAMYRKGPRLTRFAGKHIRMLPPLGARHLDFYLDKSNLPPDYMHYHEEARRREVNHMMHLDGFLKK